MIHSFSFIKVDSLNTFRRIRFKHQNQTNTMESTLKTHWNPKCYYHQKLCYVILGPLLKGLGGPDIPWVINSAKKIEKRLSNWMRWKNCYFMFFAFYLLGSLGSFRVQNPVKYIFLPDNHHHNIINFHIIDFSLPFYLWIPLNPIDSHWIALIPFESVYLKLYFELV